MPVAWLSLDEMTSEDKCLMGASSKAQDVDLRCGSAIELYVTSPFSVRGCFYF